MNSRLGLVGSVRAELGRLLSRRPGRAQGGPLSTELGERILSGIALNLGRGQAREGKVGGGAGRVARAGATGVRPPRLEVRLELPRTPKAAGIARHWVCEQFAGELRNSEMASAKLVISELVTNAVVHGRGRITLSAWVDTEYLHVDVRDNGKRFMREIRAPSLDRAGGWGLKIVDAEATQWGIGEEATTNVWFELVEPSASSAANR